MDLTPIYDYFQTINIGPLGAEWVGVLITITLTGIITLRTQSLEEFKKALLPMAFLIRIMGFQINIFAFFIMGIVWLTTTLIPDLLGGGILKIFETTIKERKTKMFGIGESIEKERKDLAKAIPKLEGKKRLLRLPEPSRSARIKEAIKDVDPANLTAEQAERILEATRGKAKEAKKKWVRIWGYKK